MEPEVKARFDRLQEALASLAELVREALEKINRQPNAPQLRNEVSHLGDLIGELGGER